jgi:hypothetical protein
VLPLALGLAEFVDDGTAALFALRFVRTGGGFGTLRSTVLLFGCVMI